MTTSSALPVINKPVRKIVPGCRGVTGSVPLFGKYESSLERDLMEMLRFDHNIEQFTPQPLTIDYLDRDGSIRTYTPDGFIKFKALSSPYQLPILFEVKYREDFRKDWKNLLPKFRAAKSYCMTRGWRFEVFTEREIRIPYLKNVKFLWSYLERVPEASVKAHVLALLNDLDEADPDLLLCALCSDATNRARFIPVIWHLVATGAIDCDLNQALTMRSLTSSLDAPTAEHFAATINQLKGKVTMLFITHALPKNLMVDEVVRIGAGALSAVTMHQHPGEHQ